MDIETKLKRYKALLDTLSTVKVPMRISSNEKVRKCVSVRPALKPKLAPTQMNICGRALFVKNTHNSICTQNGPCVQATNTNFGESTLNDTCTRDTNSQSETCDSCTQDTNTQSSVCTVNDAYAHDANRQHGACGQVTNTQTGVCTQNDAYSQDTNTQTSVCTHSDVYAEDTNTHNSTDTLIEAYAHNSTCTNNRTCTQNDTGACGTHDAMGDEEVKIHTEQCEIRSKLISLLTTTIV